MNEFSAAALQHSELPWLALCSISNQTPRPAHSFLFNFLFNFSSSFHFHFLQLLQHFQPDPAPCALLFFSTFTFKNFLSTFHFHFLQLLQQLFQPDPAPCTLLFFSTFYLTFKNFSSTFHFHFLQLLQQLFQPDPAPCTLLSFLLNFPLPQKLLVRLSLYFFYFALSLIFTTTVFNLHLFITCMPPFWHFIEQMYMSTQMMIYAFFRNIFHAIFVSNTVWLEGEVKK